MLRTVQSLIRITSIVATLLVIGAIGLGRLSPDSEGRSVASGLLFGVAPRLPGPEAGELLLLDIKEGQVHSVPIDPTDRIDLAIGSPWVDSWDQTHVVGRWRSIAPDGTFLNAGLARIAYPSGRILERVPLDRYPTAAPCWGSGTSSRILFASGDGGLYRFDFDSDETAESPGFEGQPGLRRVSWAVDTPGDGAPIVLDLGRPDGILPGDVVLATVIPRTQDDHRGRSERSRLWWLRLDPQETTVLDWGEICPEDPEGKDIGRRCPSLGRGADGSIRLAYLSWDGVPDRMTLRVAPVRIAEQTGMPVTTGPGVPLARGCLTTPLTFTEHGSLLTCLTFEGNQPVPLQIALDHSPSTTALAVAGLRILPGL